MIVRLEDFKNEASIPGLLPESDFASPANDIIRESVEDYIAKYEPQFLRDFLRDEDIDRFFNYSELADSDQTDSVLNGQLARLRFSISCFVAFHWFRSQTNTMIGGVVLGSENGRNVSLGDTMVTLWNQMVANNIVLHKDIYGDGLKYDKGNELFRNVNGLNI